MKDKEYLEIPLAELSDNPKNPRKRFAGTKFDELVASVKEKGVIEPIIVRPKKLKNTSYEIVAGERRYHASELAGLKTIPAIVRELTDDQAFDFMLIENLQREDLTEFEEAESFRLYVGKHGEAGVRELVGRTAISPQYIRRRMAVLDLPVNAIEAWRKGRIRYGHLEQLLRVRESAAKTKEFFRLASQAGRWDEPMTVEELRRRIDQESPALRFAYFPITPEGCETCPKNTRVQRDLFGIDDAQKSRCLDPGCFKKRQNDWLLANWKESPPGKKYGTSGFRFRDKVQYNDHEMIRYNFAPDEKCKACPHFLTVIDNDGRPVQGDEQECFNKPCLRSRTSKMRGETTSKEKKERKPGEPRVSWHGEYFRDVFLERRLPETLAGFSPASIEMKTLLLVTALHGNVNARETIGRALKINKAGQWMNQAQCYAKILGLPYADVDRLIPEAVKAIVMEGQHVGDYSGFGTTNRFAVARFLGIDLGKEWAVNEEYLAKKTRIECISFIKRFNLQKDLLFKGYIEKKFKRTVEKLDGLKKSEIVDSILKCGVNLTGKVPEEILKVKS